MECHSSKILVLLARIRELYQAGQDRSLEAAEDELVRFLNRWVWSVFYHWAKNRVFYHCGHGDGDAPSRRASRLRRPEPKRGARARGTRQLADELVASGFAAMAEKVLRRARERGSSLVDLRPDRPPERSLVYLCKNLWDVEVRALVRREVPSEPERDDAEARAWDNPTSPLSTARSFIEHLDLRYAADALEAFEVPRLSKTPARLLRTLMERVRRGDDALPDRASAEGIQQWDEVKRIEGTIGRTLDYRLRELRKALAQRRRRHREVEVIVLARGDGRLVEARITLEDFVDAQGLYPPKGEER